MTDNFRIGLPEAAGLAIVGGTAGALLGGAAEGRMDIFGLLGGVIGAIVPCAIVLLPRARHNSDQ